MKSVKSLSQISLKNIISSPVACSGSALGIAFALVSGNTVFAKTVPARAVAEIVNAEGKVIGNARFREKNGKTRIDLKLRKGSLSAGKHGIHIHENGVCEGPDFKSAGGHFGAAG